MEIGRPPYKVLLLVCTNLRDDGRASCGARDSRRLYEELKLRVKALDLPFRARVSQSGCLDMCAFGPTVLIYPEGRLYTGVRLEDLDVILEETFGPLSRPSGPALA